MKTSSTLASDSTLVNRARLNRLLDERGLDAVIASTAANVLYLSGMYSLGQWFIPGFEAYAIQPREDGARPRLVFTIGDSDLIAERDLNLEAYYPYGTFFVLPPQVPGVTLHEADQRLAELAQTPPASSAVAALRNAIDDLPAHIRRIGIDEAAMPPATRAALNDAYPHLEFESAGDLLLKTRLVKTAEEARRLTYAARATEIGMRAVVDSLHEGMTELQAMAVLHTSLVEQGVEPRISVIGFGTHSAYSNATPGERRLSPGDIVRFDIAGLYRHYWSDLSRCAVLGQPSERISAYYDALLLGEDACLAAVRGGVPASSVFDSAMQVVRDNGIPQYERQHVGHGIGLDVYDPPILKAGEQAVLETGMLLNVETPYYELGFGGLQVEDLILVTDDGCELLTQTDRGLWVRDVA